MTDKGQPAMDSISGSEEALAKLPSVKRFRHAAAFGRRIEYWIIGLMMKEGMDVYVPLVDDKAIDAIIRRSNGSFVEVQIKACSKTNGDAAFFAGISHPEIRNNYWFIFYSERLDKIWLMTSSEFIDHSNQNKSGKNAGDRSILISGYKKDAYYGKPKFDKFLTTDFKRIAEA